MSNERTPYFAERLSMVAAGLIGLALLYLSVTHESYKFLSKLAEAVGTGLILVTVLDFVFDRLRAFARSKDRSELDAMENNLETMKQWIADTHQANTDRILERIEKRLDKISAELGTP